MRTDVSEGTDNSAYHSRPWSISPPKHQWSSRKVEILDVMQSQHIIGLTMEVATENN